MAELVAWIEQTPVSWFVLEYGWIWPICESIHFCGLTLMAGTVGLFDLRLLGVGRGIAPRSLHRLIRWGLVGFAFSVATGLLFIAGMPDQYFYNLAFKVKVVCLFLIGCNVMLFYSLESKRVLALGADDEAPPAAKWMAAASLGLLACVMCAGRMLTFFRPPPY
jgi:hypothetical protein